MEVKSMQEKLVHGPRHCSQKYRRGMGLVFLEENKDRLEADLTF